MASVQTRLVKSLKRLFELLWAYTGTLAAMALMVGTLGMGIYHAVKRVGGSALSADESRMEYFLGVENRAGAELPRGLSPLPENCSVAGGNVLRFEYGQEGRLQRVLHLNEQGLPSAMPGSAVAEQRLSYDGEGRLLRKENLNAAGQLVPDASGVAERSFAYDAAGRLTRVSFRDASRRAIVPTLPGYASAITIYDAAGRPLVVEYQDAAGKPITNAAGEQRVEYSYDDSHGSTTRRNVINGQLADNAHGYAVEKRERTKDGTLLRLAWETAEGTPARHPDWAAASVLTEYAADGSIVRERYCGENGVMLEGGRPMAEKLVRCNASGTELWECYNAADGLPCMNPDLGYAERVSEYSSDARLQRETFWDERGNPAACHEKRYTQQGGREHVLSLHADGSTTYAPIGENE